MLKGAAPEKEKEDTEQDTKDTLKGSEPEMRELVRLKAETEEDVKRTMRIPRILQEPPKLEDLQVFVLSSMSSCCDLIDSINEQIAELEDSNVSFEVRKFYQQEFALLSELSDQDFRPGKIKEKIKECLGFLLEYKITYSECGVEEDIDYAIEILKEADEKINDYLALEKISS